jgi:TfoX/Sxy family transcriptional regulator of competence genes
MGYDEKTVDRIRRVLASRRDVTETYMMGGLSFMVGGSMACRVSKRGFLIRVTPDNRAEILAMPHVKALEMASRRMSAFVAIAPEGYRTDGELKAWVQRGVGNALARASDGGGKKPAKKAAAKKATAKKRATKSGAKRR